MSTLINYLCKNSGINIKTIASYNHQSILAEHGIKSLATVTCISFVSYLLSLYIKYASIV